MAKGARIAQKWPMEPPAVYPIDDCLGTKLPALIGTTLGYLILNSDLRKIVQDKCATCDIEYLPINLLNRKGRLQSQDYCLVNPIGTVDCLDHERSKIAYTDKGEVIEVDVFVLDPRCLKGVPALFRIKEDPSKYVLTEPLASAFADHAFTNVLLHHIEVAPLG
jgi:hypothetical protein